MNSKKNIFEARCSFNNHKTGDVTANDSRERTMVCGFQETGMQGFYRMWAWVQKKNHYTEKPYMSHHPGSPLTLCDKNEEVFEVLFGFQHKKLTRHTVYLMRKYMKPENMAWFKDLSTSAERNLGDAITQLASHPESSARPDKMPLSQHLPWLPFASQTEQEETPHPTQCYCTQNQVKGWKILSVLKLQVVWIQLCYTET